MHCTALRLLKESFKHSYCPGHGPIAGCCMLSPRESSCMKATGGGDYPISPLTEEFVPKLVLVPSASLQSGCRVGRQDPFRRSGRDDEARLGSPLLGTRHQHVDLLGATVSCAGGHLNSKKLLTRRDGRSSTTGPRRTKASDRKWFGFLGPRPHLWRKPDLGLGRRRRFRLGQSTRSDLWHP